MAITLNQPSTMQPVVISYTDLLQDDFSSLHSKILAAFGDKTLGLLIIDALPEEWKTLRYNCLLKAAEFAMLPDEIREKYSDVASAYSFGWSLGKEVFDGKPDTLKGSYYAHPSHDVRDMSDKALQARFKAYFNPNIWPSEEDCPGYQAAFKALSSFMVEVGIKLARVLDHLVQKHTPQGTSIAAMIQDSKTSKARLLHYFPPVGQKLSVDGSAVATSPKTTQEDDMCSWHLDHSLITALCPAMYLFHPDSDPKASYPIPCPSSSAGLFIKPRGSEQSIRAVVPSDCIAFQTGEALQLLTAGRLAATPHSVRAGDANGPASRAVLEALPEHVRHGQGVVSRETMAVFLQPNVDVVLTEDGKTFGDFSDEVLKRHYTD